MTLSSQCEVAVPAEGKHGNERLDQQRDVIRLYQHINKVIIARLGVLAWSALLNLGKNGFELAVVITGRQRPHVGQAIMHVQHPLGVIGHHVS